MSIDYSSLPEHMQDGAREYVEQGREPGGFLYAVLCDQLVEAFQRADMVNAAFLPGWIQWLLGEPPIACWGSPEKVAAWITARESAARADLATRMRHETAEVVAL
jgi:hypothetical protein